ncbi:MAG: patatin-like phospholipase family protein [Bacteroidetes bacterium]|nr:patatin-like phospholipase family protein [Bacteroidota bacterium]
MHKIGLVLSGGGARGFAHLGLLQVIEEQGIPIHAISGVSSGAIVGAFFAAGHKPQSILAFMKENAYFSWSNLQFKKDGFFSMQSFLNILERKIKVDSFESLSINLFVIATNFTKNESHLFSQGPLFHPVIASSSVPVIFEPVIIDNEIFIDGGVLNNFPIEPLLNNDTKIIGSYVNKIEKLEVPVGHHFGKMLMLERSLNMASATSSYLKKNQCDVFIEPLLEQYKMFDSNDADAIYEIGYQTALNNKDKLLKLVG